MKEFSMEGMPTVFPERDFLNPQTRVRCLGGGSMGGKAQGLVSIRNVLHDHFRSRSNSTIKVDIPPFVVIRTDIFDGFMRGGDLYKKVATSTTDEQLAHSFQEADLPFEVLGDLRSIIEDLHRPLAIRSSSLLEDATRGPFAGIYETKMIPNGQFDADVRFRQLMEAIKLVYASTFFNRARDYRKRIGKSDTDEKMAAIIQEIVGKPYRQRFYPELSGVARSYNYYPVKPATPGEGVANLALGLGKTIVDGGISWTYSPAHPEATPPFRSAEETLELTQNSFWAVNMGEPADYDPIRETEYMLEENISEADSDETLQYLASTYDAASERLVAGTGIRGARALTFAPLLVMKIKPFNEVVLDMLRICQEEVQAPVEVEFAMTFDPDCFYLLQVRPMVVPEEEVTIVETELSGENVLLASDNVLGNGSLDFIRDIVFVKPEEFDLKFTAEMVPELEAMNHTLLKDGTPYLLIVLGRLGTTDPWLGIPANWGQVSGARAVVEVARENVNVELSQGSHYFHNIINLGVLYFCMKPSEHFTVDWDWLKRQPIKTETRFLRHVELSDPLIVRVDGRNCLGVVQKHKGMKLP
jgi:hypothetical protein